MANKLVINMVRTFPAIILAIMFFRGVGPGPLAGALALTVYTTGVLGKLYTEIVEAVDSRVLEAMESTGATPAQVWFFGLLPRVLPDFLAASLYRLESNVRTATILGMIGAGGIGTWLMMNLSARNWERVGLLLMGMMVTVMLVDVASGHLRRRLT
jgi:phosphonate transport system permease protein